MLQTKPNCKHWSENRGGPCSLQGPQFYHDMNEKGHKREMSISSFYFINIHCSLYKKRTFKTQLLEHDCLQPENLNPIKSSAGKERQCYCIRFSKRTKIETTSLVCTLSVLCPINFPKRCVLDFPLPYIPYPPCFAFGHYTCCGFFFSFPLAIICIAQQTEMGSMEDLEALCPGEKLTEESRVL